MKYKYTCGIALMAVVLSTSACSSKDNGSKKFDEGVSYMEKGNYGEALGSFEQALEKNKDDSEYLVSYGTALIKNGKYEEAADAFAKAYKDTTKKKQKEWNKKALRGQGIALYYANKDKEAVSSLLKAEELEVLDDLNQDIKEYLAKCYLNLKDYDAAVSTYDSLLEIDKKNYMYYIEKARALKAENKIKATEDTLNAALSMKAKSETEKYQSAVCLYELSKEEEAMQILDSIKDAYADAWALLGDIYFNDRSYDEAISCYEHYLEVNKNGDISEVSDKLSRNYIIKNEFKKAIQVIEEALDGKTIKEKQNLLYNQILCYEKEADFNKAYELAKEYVKAYPKDERMTREFIFLQSRFNQ